MNTNINMKEQPIPMSMNTSTPMSTITSTATRTNMKEARTNIYTRMPENMDHTIMITGATTTRPMTMPTNSPPAQA